MSTGSHLDFHKLQIIPYHDALKWSRTSLSSTQSIHIHIHLQEELIIPGNLDWTIADDRPFNDAYFFFMLDNNSTCQKMTESKQPFEFIETVPVINESEISPEFENPISGDSKDTVREKVRYTLQFEYGYYI